MPKASAPRRSPLRRSLAGALRGLVATALILAVAAPVAATEAAAEPLDPTPLLGRWKLDAERSDSIEPMMERLDVPWFVQKLAASMEPTLTITQVPDGLLVRNENPIRETEETLFRDGRRYKLDDPLGREVYQRCQFGTPELKVVRHTEVEEGRILEVEATWRRRGADLVLESRVRSPGDPDLVIRRVFRPLD